MSPALVNPRGDEIAEIIDINQEFLRLLIYRPPGLQAGALGLEPATIVAVAELSEEQFAAVAGVPMLLAEFSPFPGLTFMPAEHRVAEQIVDPGWQQQLYAFSNRLMTFVWQCIRRDRLLGAFCIGLDQLQAGRLQRMSFSELSRSADHALGCLRARLSDHPLFWPDILRAVRSGDPEQALAAQLAVIQLSVAGNAPQLAAATYREGGC